MARLWFLVAAALICAGCIPVCNRETVCELEDTRLCDGVMLRPCDGSTIGDVVPCPLNRSAICGPNGWRVNPLPLGDGGLRPE
jgi:hypothetical protein